MACAPTLVAALQALADSPLRAADRKAGVRRAVELFYSGPVIPTVPVVSVATVDDSSFNPFDELQAVHAAVNEAGRDGSTARAVRDALRAFGDEGHKLANVTDRLRKHRNLKGHHPVGLARAVGTLLCRATSSLQTGVSSVAGCTPADGETPSESTSASDREADEQADPKVLEMPCVNEFHAVETKFDDFYVGEVLKDAACQAGHGRVACAVFDSPVTAVGSAVSSPTANDDLVCEDDDERRRGRWRKLGDSMDDVVMVGADAGPVVVGTMVRALAADDKYGITVGDHGMVVDTHPKGGWRVRWAFQGADEKAHRFSDDELEAVRL
jgi:hypothetical protein